MIKIVLSFAVLVLITFVAFQVIKPKTIKLDTAYIEHDGKGNVILMEWRNEKDVSE